MCLYRAKVMAYVLSHDELRQHLESTGPEGNEGGVRAEGGEGVAPREYPEDLVEVLCGDRVLEPHLYVGETRVERRTRGVGCTAARSTRPSFVVIKWY